MAIDLDKIFSRGGGKLIQLLGYGVRAMHFDLLFVFLVEEYRRLPSASKALAIYEIFCASGAPARPSCADLLPPRNLELDRTLRPLLANAAQARSARSSGTAPPPPFLPAKFIFDAVAAHLRGQSKVLRKIKRQYRMKRTAVENLPGGQMTSAQRQFVDRVWRPQLGPGLVEAGFRQVASIV